MDLGLIDQANPYVSLDLLRVWVSAALQRNVGEVNPVGCPWGALRSAFHHAGVFAEATGKEQVEALLRRHLVDSYLRLHPSEVCVVVQDAPEHPGWKKLSVQADGIEFVVCDVNKVDWDKPPDWYGKPNYLIESGGSFSLQAGQLRKVRTDRVLVVTDLDHTLVGHERDPGNKLVEEFRNLWLGEFCLNGSALCYSTGRNKKDALGVAQERGLPRPELLICGVGTEVYKVPRELPLMGWWEAPDDQLRLDPGWKATMELFDRSAAEAKLVSQFPRFDMRGSPEHDPYRIPTAYEMDEHFETGIASLREALGSEYQVISSGEGAWKLVDVCSAHAGKLKAMEFAMSHLNFVPSSTLACGDSGNDELMYRCKGARMVMVSNALSELVKAMTAAAHPPQQELQRGTVFETRHGSTVLFSEREVAGGICEALGRFWPAA